MKLSYAITCATTLLCGCWVWFPPPDIRLKRPVEPNEVIGCWELMESSLNTVTNAHFTFDPYIIKGKPEHKIVFNSDGTCIYQSLMQMPTKYVNTNGTWKITQDSKEPKISKLEIIHHKQIYFSLDFMEKEKELIIWEFWGDPDDWQFLKYKKMKDSEQPD